MQQTLLSSVNHTYNTPPEFLELARQIGPIRLDPCSNPTSVVGASLELMLERGQDGLAFDWLDHGFVFVNPPYGRELPNWIDKANQSWDDARTFDRSFEALLLVPARTDTRWFSRALLHATSLGFWRGRITFLGAKDPAPFPSLLIYYGLNADLFEAAFDKKAHIWDLPHVDI